MSYRLYFYISLCSVPNKFRQARTRSGRAHDISHRLRGIKIGCAEIQEMRRGYKYEYFTRYRQCDKFSCASLCIQFMRVIQKAPSCLRGTINISASRVAVTRQRDASHRRALYVLVVVAFATNAYNSSLVSVTNFSLNGSTNSSIMFAGDCAAATINIARKGFRRDKPGSKRRMSKRCQIPRCFLVKATWNRSRKSYRQQTVVRSHCARRRLRNGPYEASNKSQRYDRIASFSIPAAIPREISSSNCIVSFRK